MELFACPNSKLVNIKASIFNSFSFNTLSFFYLSNIAFLKVLLYALLQSIARIIPLGLLTLSICNLIKLCAELVSAKSFNPPGDTLETTSVLEKFFSASGISSEIIAKKKNKPNLISRAKGISKGLKLLFNGHMDTIGIGDESLWTVPIFSLTKKSGKLYGIGMGNMKGLWLQWLWPINSLMRTNIGLVK